MTYTTHTQNVPATGNIPEDRFDTGNLRAIIVLFENYILTEGEDNIENGKYVAPTYSIFWKCWREMNKHNMDTRKNNLGNNEHNTDDAANTPTPEDDAAARAALADALFKLQHSTVHKAAMARNSIGDDPSSY